MMLSAHILCFSKDVLLLRTRQAILARYYAVAAVASLQELVALPPVPPVDVAVFCHTLEEGDCRPAADLFRKRWPGGSIIALAEEDAPCSRVNPDHMLSGIAGPLALLSSIRTALNEQQVRRIDGQLHQERSLLPATRAHL